RRKTPKRRPAEKASKGRGATTPKGTGPKVRFWGVRGSVPAPGPATAKYGGNTSCVEVRCGDELLIFDLGTGVRSLGDAYGAPLSASIFVSHYHYDHLQGLPFFTPIFNP